MERQKIVDYLKALFIVLVIINHAGIINENSVLYLLGVAQAVPCFMILSGYTFALTAKGEKIGLMYDRKKLGKKFLRFTIPTVIVYGIYLIGWQIRGEYRLGTDEVIYRFVMGLYGPGGYYYGMMIQFLILAPVIFWLVKKYDRKGVMLAGGITFLYELICQIAGVNDDLYRVLILRYLLFLILGMYLHIHRKDHVKKIYLIIAVILGIFYLMIPVYGGYEYKIFTRWSSTSMVAAFYIYPILYMIFHKLNAWQISGWVGSLLELIGRASYHIMYAQLLYFVGIKDVLYSIFDLKRMGNVVELAFAIFLSVVGGVAFYYADQQVFGRLYRKA